MFIYRHSKWPERQQTIIMVDQRNTDMNLITLIFYMAINIYNIYLTVRNTYPE